MSLKNRNKQFRLKYDSNDESLVVHRKESELPNIEFQMHSSGLNVYHLNEPIESNTTFISTVSENMKAFTKREIKVANMARQIYPKLLYPYIRTSDG